MAKMTLKAARVNASLTQKNAAKKIGVSNKTLCSWENGVTFPDASKIVAICDTYCVSYDDLIFLPNNPLSANYKQ